MKVRSNLYRLGLIAFIGFAVGHSWALPAISDQTIAPCSSDNNNAEELATITTTKGKVVRQQGQLRIKTRRGVVAFTDVCTGDPVNHKLVSYFADVRYFLVHSVSIEYNEYTLINEKTGVKTTLYGVPVFSPNRQRFTAMVIDELNGLTSIEIYRLTTAGLTREYKNTKVKAPANPIWKNNSTIEFQRSLTLGSEQIPAKLVRKNSVWKLS
jgi:hypothetical protein